MYNNFIILSQYHIQRLFFLIVVSFFVFLGWFEYTTIKPFSERCQLNFNDVCSTLCHLYLINKSNYFIWFVFAVIEKVFFYPLSFVVEGLMDHIKDFSLDLEKVSQDFAKLTPPEFSSNIVLRFIHYNVSSPFPITIFILLVCSKYYIWLYLTLMM